MRTITICLLALGLAACASPPDSGAGLAEAERTYPRKAEEVWAAAMSAARDLDLTVDSHEHDSLGGRVEARRAEGGRIHIGVRSVEPDKAQVSVRMDARNRGLAELIFDRITTKLGTGARPPAPSP